MLLQNSHCSHCAGERQCCPILESGGTSQSLGACKQECELLCDFCQNPSFVYAKIREAEHVLQARSEEQAVEQSIDSAAAPNNEENDGDVSVGNEMRKVRPGVRTGQVGWQPAAIHDVSATAKVAKEGGTAQRHSSGQLPVLKRRRVAGGFRPPRMAAGKPQQEASHQEPSTVHQGLGTTPGPDVGGCTQQRKTPRTVFRPPLRQKNACSGQTSSLTWQRPDQKLSHSDPI
eukprot:evm.model.scf_1208EXC.4 EVM.evm.TU.scf_1208EXC.4   scf_1208EXC:22520-23928(-)